MNCVELKDMNKNALMITNGVHVYIEPLDD